MGNQKKDTKCVPGKAPEGLKDPPKRGLKRLQGASRERAMFQSPPERPRSPSWRATWPFA